MDNILYFQNKMKEKKITISSTGFNIRVLYPYKDAKMQVLVTEYLHSHEISTVYQLFSSELTLYTDFKNFFYLPTCHSG